jgi:uncharacterized membrane protein
VNDWLFVLTFLSALGSGVMAGVFFAFSAFVMKALARLPAAQGIAAMQSINVVVLNPLFLGVFLGTGAACLVLGIVSVAEWHTPGAVNRLAGSAIYLLGTLTVTRVFNVPRNDALAAVEPASIDGSTLWADYIVSWTAWNHVRTAAALLASAIFALALGFFRSRAAV